METAENQGRHALENEHGQGKSHHQHESHHHHHHEYRSHHHHDHEAHHHDEPMSQEEAVQSLLVLGQVALGAADYESAVEAYASVLKLEPNEAAAYNLGSLYARGLGVRKDFTEAARLFHQAELLGNERAGKLCGKCLFDYVHEGFADGTPADLYAAMAVFVSRVYPEAADAHQEINHGLLSVASTCYSKGSFAEAAKAFRAAAEFGADGYAQYNLAVLYNAGIGLRGSDLAALYWLDRAVDNGAEDVAREERDGMLDAYRQGLSDEAFRAMMAELADWCEDGTPDVPADPAKASHWRALA